MIFNLLSEGVSAQSFIYIIFFVVIFFMTITVHECAHGYIAYRLGDPTAKYMGRLTLNPVRHIDPIGLILIMVIGFGWAKPVPINPRNFKNPKSGMAVSAAAGPVSNLLMAALGSILFAALGRIFIYTGFINGFSISAVQFFNLFATLNVWFAVFNMIPLPPLDGSRIVSYFLPPKYHYYYNYVERYGFLILILLLNLGRINRNLDFIRILQAFSGWILSGMDFVIDSIFSLFGG